MPLGRQAKESHSNKS